MTLCSLREVIFQSAPSVLCFSVLMCTFWKSPHVAFLTSSESTAAGVRDDSSFMSHFFSPHHALPTRTKTPQCAAEHDIVFMPLCMYVCSCVCMYAHVYACLLLCASEHLRVLMFVCVHVYVFLFMCLCAVCIHAFLVICVCVFLCMTAGRQYWRAPTRCRAIRNESHDVHWVVQLVLLQAKCTLLVGCMCVQQEEWRWVLFKVRDFSYGTLRLRDAYVLCILLATGHPLLFLLRLFCWHSTKLVTAFSRPAAQSSAISFYLYSIEYSVCQNLSGSDSIINIFIFYLFD